MALQLESEIMAEIGLGQHYQWFNGSGSCFAIRSAAARKLPEVLKARGMNPIPTLVTLVKDVAEWETSGVGGGRDYVLTKTWQCASEVIRSHMPGYHSDERTQRLIDIYRPAQVNRDRHRRPKITKDGMLAW